MNKLAELIKKHEGTGPVKNGNFMPYEDSEGYLTIGYGFCIQITGLSKDECDFILNNRLEKVKKECSHTFSWFSVLNEPRQTVIVSMVYNLGLNGFNKFKKTIRYIEQKDYYKASIEMLDSRWANQVGYRARELSQIIRTGNWL